VWNAIESGYLYKHLLELYHRSVTNYIYIDKCLGIVTLDSMGSAVVRLQRWARDRAVVHARDLKELNIPRTYLSRFAHAGILERLGRGLYRAGEAPVSENQTLLEVSKKLPHAVICLSSALRFHELTTQNPFEVWIALKRGAWSPQPGYPPIRVVRFSAASLQFGVEEHVVYGGKIRVYSPAKTVADCFKFRSTMGLDVAIEALAETLYHKKATIHDLWSAAKVCRVANVMLPYVQALSVGQPVPGSIGVKAGAEP